MIKECCGFPFIESVNKILDFYLQSCSLDVDVDMMSIFAATMANYGKTPFTDKKIFDPDTVTHSLSMMTVAGMYDYSGEYSFKYGFPAKSSVSGAVMIVIPNVMGICVWSPRLDSYGNSVRGVRFSDMLSKAFGYHVYRVKNLHFDYQKSKVMSCYRYCMAIKNDDLRSVKEMYYSGLDPNSADYDNRTPLHIAASEGRIEFVKFLIDVCGVWVDPKDRWGNTPLKDAEREQYHNVAQFLKDSIKNNRVAVPFVMMFKRRETLTKTKS